MFSADNVSSALEIACVNSSTDAVPNAKLFLVTYAHVKLLYENFK